MLASTFTKNAGLNPPFLNILKILLLDLRLDLITTRLFKKKPVYKKLSATIAVIIF